ncbi:hypothetical protein WQQ_15500 [Hydrocarboniphaga effusa AP103]|uniref:Uncharacterized protein n=1 Tax=Hydrocarboniphaga effusa AP103 TaxID=1172194 RepID=I8TCL7_9GAMM|nr:hypothetical protein WQQ_15500 [Hydrocarboniphaga effusa AP103]
MVRGDRRARFACHGSSRSWYWLEHRGDRGSPQAHARRLTARRQASGPGLH